MIRVLVMANDSVLADVIASILAREIDLDKFRLTHRTLGKGNRYSAVIVVDEGEIENEVINIADFFRDDIAVLVLKLSLKSREIFVYESYQLNNPKMERIVELVRQFGSGNLKKNVERAVNHLQQISILP